VLLGGSDGALKAASASHSLSFGEPVLTPTLPQERDGTVANVVFRRASTGATILALQIASTFITEWRTTGLESRGLTCRKDSAGRCRRRAGGKGIDQHPFG